MNDGFSWWLVVLGIAVGIGLVWLFTVRLPVSESDIDDEERAEEAGWISETIESWGGVAPAPLIQEVLELHKRYLDGDRSVAGLGDEAADLPAGEPDAVVVSAPEPAEAADHSGPPPAGVSPQTYAPPAYPPAGGFSEVPPAPVRRAEPE